MNVTHLSVFHLKITVQIRVPILFRERSGAETLTYTHIPECNFIELNVPIQPRNRRSLPMCQVTKSGLNRRRKMKLIQLIPFLHSTVQCHFMMMQFIVDKIKFKAGFLTPVFFRCTWVWTLHYNVNIQVGLLITIYIFMKQ